MNINNQVCTLEQGKELRALGISNDSYLSWFGDLEPRLMDNGINGITYSDWRFVARTEPINNMDLDNRQDVCTTTPLAPAYSSAELLEMLNYSTTGTAEQLADALISMTRKNAPF